MASTIKDIAKKLNISVSTVSYALNGGPRPVPQRVRDEVLRVAKELDYRPNSIARSLITRRSYTIGVVPAEVSADMMLGPYVQFALNGIINEAEFQHQDVLIFTRYDQSTPDKIADSLLDGRIDGAIFITPLASSVVERLDRGKLPHVVISSNARSDAPCFSVDNAQGARLALEHLYDLGHRRIGHISGKPQLYDALVRKETYRSFLAERNLASRPEWEAQGDFTIDSGADCARRILSLQERPTALFCANDEMAVGAIRAARDLELDVPHDVSIVGFDDVPVGLVSYPSLTTIHQPIGEIGAMAVRALVQLIEGEPDVPGRRFDTQLVIRSSTTHPPKEAF